MCAGKLTSVLIQESFTTQYKSANCTESKNAGLVDFSERTVTFCSSSTADGLLKTTNAFREKGPYGGHEFLFQAWHLQVHHQRHSTSQSCCWTAPLTSAHQRKPFKPAAWRTTWDLISFWRVLDTQATGVGIELSPFDRSCFQSVQLLRQKDSNRFICWFWSVTFSLQNKQNITNVPKVRRRTKFTLLSLRDDN